MGIRYWSSVIPNFYDLESLTELKMKKPILAGTIAMSLMCGGVLAAYAQQMPMKDEMPVKDGMKDNMPISDGMKGKAKGGMNMGMNMKMNLKMMDTNGDGMVSKVEFMKYHEAMYDKMKKDANGMVSLKDMEMMNHDSMMKK